MTREQVELTTTSVAASLDINPAGVTIKSITGSLRRRVEPPSGSWDVQYLIELGEASQSEAEMLEQSLKDVSTTSAIEARIEEDLDVDLNQFDTTAVSLQLGGFESGSG